MKTRTHFCGELRKENIDESIVLMGWVAKHRDLGSIIFLDIRDKTGITQIVFDENINLDLYNKAKELGREYCLMITGSVRKRSSINPNIQTGDIEVLADGLEIFSMSKITPIHISEKDNASEDIKLKYRYLDLRKSSIMNRLEKRSKINKVIRDFLDENKFTEFETPILSKSTPEGARDYLVPSRLNPGKFFALPQSPQIYKQLLMISGADKYYQIARCFRDEDLRADRQPEFTQLDIEMSFVDQEMIFDLNEKMLERLFFEVADTKIKLPIKRISHKEALESYGTDKPDTRYDMKIISLEDIFKNTSFKIFNNSIESGNSLKGIFLETDKSMSGKSIKKLEKLAKTYGAKGLADLFISDEITGGISRFLSDEEKKLIREKTNNKTGILFMVTDIKKTVLTVLGNLRTYLAKEYNLYDENTFDLVWVVDFPAFTYSEDEKRYKAEHHPFTMPKEEDIKYLDSDLSKVRALCYDMVINGYETGSGSIRIHDSSLQANIFNALGLSEEEIHSKFGFFVEALKFGTPPHGGIAYGLDRLAMILTKTDNIKDIIPFPKTLSASCLMSSAPSKIEDKQLVELNIKIKE